MRGYKRLLISKEIRTDRIEHRYGIIQIHMLDLMIKIHKRIKERNERNAGNGHSRRYYKINLAVELIQRSYLLGIVLRYRLIIAVCHSRAESEIGKAKQGYNIRKQAVKAEHLAPENIDKRSFRDKCKHLSQC